MSNVTRKISKKKWAKDSVLYNPVDDKVALVITSRVENCIGAALIQEDYNSYRTIGIVPPGTLEVSEWTYLGDINGD